MKRTKLCKRAILVVLCLITVFTLSACIADMPIGNHSQLSDRFIGYVVANDFDAAYDMIKNACTEEAFSEYWRSIRSVADGAKTYTIEQVGWNINAADGFASRTTVHQVKFDNERIIFLELMTHEEIEGIANLYFRDITDFLARTAYVSVVRIVLIPVSLLMIAFVIWMFVDCLRRKVKWKVLWAILMFFGVALTFTFGEAPGLNFGIGLMLQTSSMWAEPGILSVKLRLVIPVGAIVYFFLRKQLTLIPAETPMQVIDAPVVDVPAETDSAAE